MADSQVPWGLGAQRRGDRTRVEDEAKLVPGLYRRPDDSLGRAARDVEARGSTVAEAKGSHAIYVSQPQAVAAIIATAAHGVALAAG